MKKLGPDAAILLFFTLLLVSGVLFYYGTQQASPAQEWLYTIAGLVVAVALGIHLIFYRCPHCGRHLDRVWVEGYCPHCGKKILDDK